MKKRYFICILCVFTVNGYAGSEHVHELDKLVVSSPLSQSEANTVLPVSVLSGNELMMKSATTLGETLKHEPGIVSQSFGPGVGQPVIRGQSGSRVHVLQNGLGSLDVSSLSPDHANSTEALWADRIEVLRGPMTLLYGSGAIGGVVNVLDNRIPSVMPDNLIQGALEQRYNTVNEGKSSAFKLEGGKGVFAWHLDGSYRDSIDMQIPEKAGFGKRLNNTSARTHSGTAGASVIGDKGFFGFSVNRLDNNYGVPSSDDEKVRIDMQQNRYDLKAELLDPFSFFDSLRMRLGYNDYQHVELEDGLTGTIYKNEGFEGRAELMQRPWWFFDHGVVGVQSKNSQFSAIGEEAVVPRSEIDSFGLFTVQDIHTENMSYEFGLRVEQQWVNTQNNVSTSHTPVSFSASALWSVTEQDAIKLTFSRSQRAPDIQEMFSNGAHLATSSYEIGSEILDEETSHNIELGVHIDRDWVQADFNLYQNWVNDYITQSNTGRYYDRNNENFSDFCVADCLPVFQAQQRNAEFRGFEAQAVFPLLQAETGRLDSLLFADYVRGQFSDGGNIPRMPPLRYGMQLSWEDMAWTTQIRMTRAERQNKVGLNETETNGYWLLNTSANYRQKITDNGNIMYFVKANNLLNEDIRSSVSFLRDIAPEAGRGVEIGVRVEF
ncbi:MAG: TonB-dependent receptor [Methylomarinum sp.]|nr:TonB-dependent receptor [Methylomarinum sp.]